MSGLFFGFLSYKPQMLIFPFIFLVCLRKWKILLWTIISSIFICLISGIIFGFDTWINFTKSFFVTSPALIEKDWINVAAVQPSFLSFLKLLGININLVYIIFILNLLFVIYVIRYIWKKDSNSSLKISAFVIAIILTIPYFIQYDLMLLSISFVLIISDFYKNGSKMYEKFICFLLWIMPLLNCTIVNLTKIQICPATLYIVLIMIILRVNNPKRSTIKI